MDNLLDKINTPEDFKGFSNSELVALSKEIREFLVESVAKTGGHLASNLGIVELTLALHSTFDSPKDKIIWDVGHQCYVHKIITGRKERFSTLRQYEGISGFPKRNESCHDIFDVGHSSTSISAALGIAKARDLLGENNHVVAVIGDGALTGGMALEAINHAGHTKTNLIVVLNDNEMSIAQNVGALSTYLSKIRIDPVYFRVKKDIESFFNSIPAIGKSFFKAADKIKDSLKYLLVPGILFEELGFRYYGPIDGHDISMLKTVFTRAKKVKGPVFIHIVTKKGKGYSFAEENPDKYHGVSPFSKETGKSTLSTKGKSFSQVAGECLWELAKHDNRIVAITAAMPEGTGLTKFAKEYKERFFDVGIAEQHAVTFGAGLASQGLRPFFAVYSTFLQRGYDQIIHDVCLQNLPMTFLVDRAGLVGEDGETHHGIYDLSYLMHMPNLKVLSPRNDIQLMEMIKFSLDNSGPVAIRYPRGGWKEEMVTSDYKFKEGKWEIISQGDDKNIVLIGSGKTVESCVDASKILTNKGVKVSVINATCIKPIDDDLIESLAKNHRFVVSVEDNTVIGGLGATILSKLNSISYKDKFLSIGLPDKFIEHGSVDILYKKYKIDGEGIVEQIMSVLK